MESKRELFNLVSSLVDDSLSDGAYMQMAVDIIAEHKAKFGISGNSHELMLEWLRGA